MALNLVNLDSTTRKLMIDEIKFDIDNKKLYFSNRLSPTGERDYPSLLKEAAEKHDDAWLAGQLGLNGRLNTMEQRKTKTGIVNARVPITAADTLAEGEFNRFYIRALCLRTKGGSLTIYRAKTVLNSRPDSEMKIGTSISADALLNDLQTTPGVDTALGLPPGPNSGLSAKLP